MPGAAAAAEAADLLVEAWALTSRQMWHISRNTASRGRERERERRGRREGGRERERGWGRREGSREGERKRGIGIVRRKV